MSLPGVSITDQNLIQLVSKVFCTFVSDVSVDVSAFFMDIRFDQIYAHELNG